MDCTDPTQYRGHVTVLGASLPESMRENAKIWQGTVVSYYRTILSIHSEGYNLT